MLKALRAHDARLADELDELRLSLGRQAKGGGRVRLPENVRLDCPRLLLSGFEQAFYVQAVMKATSQPTITVEQILAWADEHYAENNGTWPLERSGRVAGTDETWIGISSALKRGNRGLSSGGSLAKLLQEHRGKRNQGDLHSLTVKQILAWADEVYARTGKYPTNKSDRVAGTEETWKRLDDALKKGLRGLPSGSSLAKLLKEHRGKRNHMDLAPIAIPQVLDWTDEVHARTGKWPTNNSDRVAGTDETWKRIDEALRKGLRGLPGGMSLAMLLETHGRKRSIRNLPPFSIPQILTWVDEYRLETGEWLKRTSGRISGTEETWGKVETALSQGQRELPGGSSLAKLLDEHRRGIA